MTNSNVDQLAEALETGERVVAGVRDDQWELPTPCAEWTVRDLVHHLAGGNRFFAAVVRGEPVPPIPRRPSDVDLGDDLVAAYRDGAAQLVGTFRLPGVLDRVVSLPIGQLPGAVAVRLRLVETLVHSWDLGQAIGVPVVFRDELVEQGTAFTRQFLGAVPPDRTPFGPPQPVRPDAPALDRLAALLGRRVPQDAAP